MNDPQFMFFKLENLKHMVFKGEYLSYAYMLLFLNYVLGL